MRKLYVPAILIVNFHIAQRTRYLTHYSSHFKNGIFYFDLVKKLKCYTYKITKMSLEIKYKTLYQRNEPGSLENIVIKNVRYDFKSLYPGKLKNFKLDKHAKSFCPILLNENIK